MTGTSGPDDRILRTTSNPSPSGIITSSRIRSGLDAAATRSASIPLAAVVTSNPASRSDPDSNSRIVSSSSTTSSRASPAPSLAAKPITTRCARYLADRWMVAAGALTSCSGLAGAADRHQIAHRDKSPVFRWSDTASRAHGLFSRRDSGFLIPAATLAVLLLVLPGLNNLARLRSLFADLLFRPPWRTLAGRLRTPCRHLALHNSEATLGLFHAIPNTACDT